MTRPSLRSPLASLLALCSLACACTGGAATQAAAPAPTPVSAKELKRAIESNKGKVVLLNVWATWCGPCVEEMPDLVKLHAAYQDRGLVVLGVSMDEPEDSGKVNDFVIDKKVTFPVFTRKGKAIGELLDVIDRKFSGAIPATYVLDKSGKRVGSPMVGLRTYAQFEEAIKPLL